MENQREYYRIQYPERDRPTLQVVGAQLPILDLSETGACCLGDSLLFDDSSVVSIQIVFREGTKFSAMATLVRRDPDRLAVRFSPSIPLPIIFAEQRRLRRLSLDVEE